MTKICSTCKQLKSFEKFNKHKTTKGGYRNECKECKKKRDKIYYQKNKEKILSYQKEYTEDNKDNIKKYKLRIKDKIAQYNAEYNKKNQRVIKEYNKKNKNRTKKWANKKYHSDPTFRLRSVLRSRLYQAIKTGIKKGSAVKDLGCSVSYLKSYLESKFYFNPKTGEEMSWENWGRGSGKWQIDHIVEFRQIDLKDEKELKKVLNYNNLQPLWYCDHLEKNNKINRLSDNIIGE